MNAAEARRILDGAQRDPVGWCERVLGFRGWGDQRRILESVRDNRRTAVRSCHAAGKTRTAAAAALWFVATHPRSIVLTTATTHRQVKGIMWREIHQMVRDARVPIGGSITEAKLTLAEDWWAWGFTGDEYDPTSFQGFHAPHALVIIDEAAGVGPGVYEGLESVMSSGHARRLDIGNPTDPDCDFARSFSRKDTARFVLDAFDTPNLTETGVTIDDVRSGEWRAKVDAHVAAHGALPYPQLVTPEWVAEKWGEWCGASVEGESDPRWQSRVRAQFPTSAENALFPTEWVRLAQERHAQRDPRTGRGRLGVDVARFGKDTSQVAVYVDGYGVRDVAELPHADALDTADMVLSRVRAEELRGLLVSEVRVDADGLGGGTYDAVRRKLDDRAVEIRNGTRAQDPTRFINARSEMLWLLREALDPRGQAPIVLPPDPRLTEELRAFRWHLARDQRIAVESKDEMKLRLGRSPDRADAVAYAVFPGAPEVVVV